MEEWGYPPLHYYDCFQKVQDRAVIHPDCKNSKLDKKKVCELNIFRVPDNYGPKEINDEIKKASIIYDHHFNFFPTYNLSFRSTFPMYGKLLVTEDIKHNLIRLTEELECTHLKFSILHLAAEVIDYAFSMTKTFTDPDAVASVKTYYKQAESIQPFLRSIQEVQKGERYINKCKVMVEYEDGEKFIFSNPYLFTYFLIPDNKEELPSIDIMNKQRSVLPFHNSKYREFFRTNLILGLYHFLVSETSIKPNVGMTGYKKTSIEVIDFINDFIHCCIDSLFDDMENKDQVSKMEKRKAIIKTSISDNI